MFQVKLRQLEPLMHVEMTLLATKIALHQLLQFQVLLLSFVYIYDLWYQVALPMYMWCVSICRLAVHCALCLNGMVIG